MNYIKKLLPCCLLITLLLPVCGCSGNSFYETDVYTNSTSITSVNLLDTNADIEIKTNSDDNLKVEYMKSSKEGYDISVENGALSVKKWDKRGFFGRFWSTKLTLKVYLPKNFSGNITAKTSNGAITSENLNCNNVNLKTSNGRLSMQNCNLNSCDFITSNGKIIISNSSVSKIDGGTSNGEINVSETTAVKITLDTSNGKIKFDNLTASDISAITSNGGISGTLTGNVNDYSIKAKTSNGKCNLNNTDSGEKSLYVKTSNGNIDIEFLG